MRQNQAQALIDINLARCRRKTPGQRNTKVLDDRMVAVKVYLPRQTRAGITDANLPCESTALPAEPALYEFACVLERGRLQAFNPAFRTNPGASG
jgi:hypothetical protein